MRYFSSSFLDATSRRSATAHVKSSGQKLASTQMMLGSTNVLARTTVITSNAHDTRNTAAAHHSLKGERITSSSTLVTPKP